MNRLLLGVALLFSGYMCCYGQNAATYRGMAFPTVNVGGEEYSKIGTKAPDITITDINGNTWSLVELKGRVVYLYCYYADSISVVTDFTEMNYLAGKFRDSGAVFLVITQQSRQRMLPCLATLSAGCAVAAGQQKALEELEVHEQPVTIIINRKGRIRYWCDTRQPGMLSEQEAIMERLLCK